VVDPYGLVCKAGIWYLVADSGASRGCSGCHGSCRLSLTRRRCGAGTAWNSRDCVRFPAVKAARTLLSFGANAEVISPPEVRADLAAVAAEIVACYQSNARLDVR
jgi:hypothetical protein